MPTTRSPYLLPTAILPLLKLLTRRQWQVLRTVLDAETQRAAAERLGISQCAVGNCVARAVERFGNAGHDVTKLKALLDQCQ